MITCSTAFYTPKGLYQFVRMPFGLHGAAATFQRLVDKLLQGQGDYASAYIDDVVIYSRTWEEHLSHLEKVLARIKEAGLTVNPEKCKLGMERTNYLGFVVGNGRLEPVAAKARTIEQTRTPQSKKELQRFLGMVGYYRQFIPQFSSIAADTLRGGKRTKWEWTSTCQKAFDTLRQALGKSPVLRAPDFSKSFRVSTDASGTGVGAVLSQEFEGEEHPIIYMSRKLKPPETKYSTIEREALAVKWALENLKYYLLGAPFELITDH